MLTRNCSRIYSEFRTVTGPESLQKLHITFSEIFLVKGLVAAPEELLERSDTCVARLRELVPGVQFEGYKDHKYWHDEVTRILRVADQKGIETIVLHDSFVHGDMEGEWGLDGTVE